MLALKAGVGLEDLERTRVGIGGFSPPGNRVRLEFRADGVQAGEPDLESVLLIDLDQLAE